MVNRLGALDAAFLYVEEPTLPMHVGSVMVFQPPAEGFDYDRFIAVVGDRIAGHTRYRQRIRAVPARLDNPVWVDDVHFDLAYHVRRSALPAPGSRVELEDFVARIMARPLDRDRPLWEAYFVEGMADGTFAIITKAHQAMVDGIHAVDLAHLIIDPEAVPVDERAGEPNPEPSGLRLVADAVLGSVINPARVLQGVRSGLGDVTETGRRAVETTGRVVSTLARVGARPAPSSPLNAPVGAARRYVMVETDLDDYRQVRSRLTRGRYVDDVTINDVILATVTGALRSWMQTRGLPVTGAATVRAMVPVSIVDGSGDQLTDAAMAACFIDLPIGENAPSMRLHQISFAMRQQIESASAEGVDAGSLVSIGGFAPPTLHSLGARLGSAMSRRLFNLVITNVPGPQQALHVEGSRLCETYPVMPLGREQGLAVGLTSYDGKVYFGLNGDRETLADLGLLAQCIEDALTELRTTPGAGRSS
ncbi:WS/DGAT/MGAT family O-acyltransferase [Janibacter alittae]|uniref:Diacylglycerol O-acyltransferase n=1 Tax=Janibacter alittae TaxID=3115209 RepID=A0ABZ2MEN4_9MICO